LVNKKPILLYHKRRRACCWL